ncbi:MAG TPA: DUF447 domain-containing protein [Beijerinckiaceae bacterium]|jgi:hypothetical protein|nr:DUF447 domain-containing protein [Beijerinckiaceae bacterium]
MPMIRECVVTTIDATGHVHIAPLGLIQDRDEWIIAPFRPSATLHNLKAVPFATANYVDDVRIIAGCLTGRRDWPITDVQGHPVPRLAAALAHAEFRVSRVEDDETRPRFHCTVAKVETHAPFRGLNRAKAAVLEAAILASRLSMLPREKIDSEIAYLKIAIDKTAGPEEREAWDWLIEAVTQFYAR